MRLRLSFAKRHVLATLLWAVAGAGNADSSQGVTKDEIVVGTIQDLSGPLAMLGDQARNGMQMRAEEINDQGGVNGRRLHLIVADSGSDSKKTANAVEQLVTSDRVFAVLGALGTAENVAAMPVEFAHGVINFLPLTGAREMYEPASKLKMAFALSYEDQIKSAVFYLAHQKKYQHACILFEEDEFGAETLRGADAALKLNAVATPEKATYRRGTTDFAQPVSRFKADGCDLVILGAGARDAVAIMQEARRAGFAADFVGTSAVYGAWTHTTGGRAVDGLFAVNTVSHPYADDASKLVRDWTAAYQKRFNENPTVFSVYGYYIMDIFTKGAARAGPRLTADTFDTAMESTTFPRDMFGSPEFHLTPDQRLGSRKVRISQIVNGKWVPVTTLLDAP